MRNTTLKILTTVLFVATLMVFPLGLAAQEEAPPPEEAPPQEAPPPEPPAPPPPPDIRQVQIQVWISETGEQGLRDLGANLRYSRFVQGEEQSGSLQQISTNVFDPRKDDFTVTLPAPDQNLFDPPMRPDQQPPLQRGVQTQSGVGLNYSYIISDTGTIDAEFRAIERKADLDLISKPELLTINGTPAEIHAGGDVPYQAITYENGIPRLNVTWQPIGVKMRMTPSIMPNEMVQLNIESLDVNDVSRIDRIRGIDFPVFSTRSQTGQVLVPNGQTLVIGGLSSRVIRKTERRVPGLGRLPLLGIPFRGRSSEAESSHLLIFVSPTVVDLMRLDQAAVDALEFWRQEQWQHRERIDEEYRLLQEDF